MFRIDTITKDWKKAGSFPAQLNLYGFWDEHCFLTKTGDLGAVLKFGGIDYGSRRRVSPGSDVLCESDEGILINIKLTPFLTFAHDLPDANHCAFAAFHLFDDRN